MSKIDFQREFLEGLSKLTNISLELIVEYVRSNNPLNIIEHPGTLAVTQEQLDKIEAVNQLLFSYKNMQNLASDQKIVLDSGDKAKEYFSFLRGKKDAEVVVAYLDTKYQVIQISKVAEGGHNYCTVDHRRIVEEAILSHCHSVMIAHNHPSEIPYPSNEDIQITRKLESALGAVNTSNA